MSKHDLKALATDLTDKDIATILAHRGFLALKDQPHIKAYIANRPDDPAAYVLAGVVEEQIVSRHFKSGHLSYLTSLAVEELTDEYAP